MEEQKSDILNVYLDLFLKEIGEENRCAHLIFLTIYRFVKPFFNEYIEISYPDFIKYCNIKSDNTVSNSIKKLEKLNLIQIKKHEKGGKNQYKINVEFLYQQYNLNLESLNAIQNKHKAIKEIGYLYLLKIGRAHV